jgi:dUTP pyrophosphatase
MKVCLTRSDAVMPSKSLPGDAGFDVTVLDVYKDLGNGVKLYDTGVTVAPPAGYYLDLVARSSLVKHGYMLANGVGIIDNGYRGHILVALRKFDPTAPDLELPARVAQLVPRQIHDLLIVPVKSLDENTERGAGGFGSTK